MVAVERGYFPISHTGYWSLSGFGVGQPDPLFIKPEVLESLAEAKDRERKAILINLHRAVKPARGPTENFVHVSLYVDRAIDEGFFAPDRERTQIWQTAHRLLCLVDTDPQFQPLPDRFAWGVLECEKALVNIRNLHACLKRFAQGVFSGELPWPLFGARAYAKLPPKPSDEPAVALNAPTIEMSLDLSLANGPLLATPRIKPQITTSPVQHTRQPTQLDLLSGDNTLKKTLRIST